MQAYLALQSSQLLTDVKHSRSLGNHKGLPLQTITGQLQGIAPTNNDVRAIGCPYV